MTYCLGTLFEINHGLCLRLSGVNARRVTSRRGVIIRSFLNNFPAPTFRLSLPLSACAGQDGRRMGVRGFWRYAVARWGLVHNHWLRVWISITRRIMTHGIILWRGMPRHAWSAWTTLLRRGLWVLGMRRVCRIHWIRWVHHIMLRRIWLIYRLRTRTGRVRRPWSC